jgi:hypothetical protein
MKEGSKPQHINECHGCDFAEFSFRLLRAEAKLLAEVSLGIYRAALSGDIRASSLILDRFEWEDLVEEERVQLSREQIGTSMRELEQLISQVKSTRKITQNSGY